jgi:diaminopimelate decarboxylase
VEDRVFLGTAGAYTTSYASDFNGFPVPRTYVSVLVDA